MTSPQPVVWRWPAPDTTSRPDTPSAGRCYRTEPGSYPSDQLMQHHQQQRAGSRQADMALQVTILPRQYNSITTVIHSIRDPLEYKSSVMSGSVSKYFISFDFKHRVQVEGLCKFVPIISIKDISNRPMFKVSSVSDVTLSLLSMCGLFDDRSSLEQCKDFSISRRGSEGRDDPGKSHPSPPHSTWPFQSATSSARLTPYLEL